MFIPLSVLLFGFRFSFGHAPVKDAANHGFVFDGRTGHEMEFMPEEHFRAELRVAQSRQRIEIGGQAEKFPGDDQFQLVGPSVPADVAEKVLLEKNRLIEPFG